MERWKSLDAQQAELQKEKDFQHSLQQSQTEEDRKTAKRRKKRQREKEAKLRKKNLNIGVLENVVVCRSQYIIVNE